MGKLRTHLSGAACCERAVERVRFPPTLLKGKTMRFRDLAIGDQFRFSSERTMPASGLATGPWRKISSRRYVHCESGMTCTVGTINVEVDKE